MLFYKGAGTLITNENQIKILCSIVMSKKILQENYLYFFLFVPLLFSISCLSLIRFYTNFRFDFATVKTCTGEIFLIF